MTCPACGSRYAPEHRFCGICGAELRAGQSPGERASDAARPARPVHPLDQGVEFPRRSPAAEPPYTQPADDALPYYIPPARVIVLTLLSSGLYVFYWMYVTWRQYRDHTGEIAYPVMHALALLVPVYQFFRLHAHIRVYQELMEQRGVPTTLNPLRAVLIYFGVVLLGMVSLMIPARTDRNPTPTGDLCDHQRRPSHVAGLDYVASPNQPQPLLAAPAGDAPGMDKNQRAGTGPGSRRFPAGLGNVADNTRGPITADYGWRSGTIDCSISSFRPG